MVYAPNEERNQRLVQKRVRDPKTWTWAKLGEYFAVHRSVAKEIFERDLEKFANECEIERYEKKIKALHINRLKSNKVV